MCGGFISVLGTQGFDSVDVAAGTVGAGSLVSSRSEPRTLAPWGPPMAALHDMPLMSVRAVAVRR